MQNENKIINNKKANVEGLCVLVVRCESEGLARMCSQENLAEFFPSDKLEV